MVRYLQELYQIIHAILQKNLLPQLLEIYYGTASTYYGLCWRLSSTYMKVQGKIEVIQSSMSSSAFVVEHDALGIPNCVVCISDF